MRYAILIAFLCAFPKAGISNTWQVPGDFEKIQDALEAAKEGDTIRVMPGTYYEHIDFQGKAITLKSSQ